MADDYKFDNSILDSFDSGTSEKKDVYFAEEDFATKLSEEKNEVNIDLTSEGIKAKRKKKKKKGASFGSTTIFFIVVIVISVLLSVYAVFCLNDIFGFTKSTTTVTVSYDDEIETASEAIDLLYDEGLIQCKYFCKFFVKAADAILSSHDVEGPYAAGVYYLYGKMGLEGMLTTMQGQADTAETVTLTFPEGSTVADIVEKLSANEVCDSASLLSVIQSSSFSYSLVSSLESSEEVPYRLEGYLFPDTYEFYIGQSASSTIETFISNLENKITEEYRDRAEELGFTMYEILTIASIVQAEAGSTEQMATIASVIENRLADTANFPSLGCQSTSDYITNDVEPSLSSTSSHTSEYYLTYYNTNTDSTVVGLPAGPICNPGLDAIEAALYPDDTDYYYFFHDTDGTLYTAETYSEFKSLVATYAPYLEY